MWLMRFKYTDDGLKINYEVGYLQLNSFHAMDFVKIYSYKSLEEAEQKVHYLNGGN